MKQKLIIEWDKSAVYVPPFKESLFVKTPERAREILKTRNMANIKAAMYQGIDLLK